MAAHAVARCPAWPADATTMADQHAARPADLVRRRFTAAAPDRLWVADFDRHEAPWDSSGGEETCTRRAVAAVRLQRRAAPNFTKP